MRLAWFTAVCKYGHYDCARAEHGACANEHKIGLEEER